MTERSLFIQALEIADPARRAALLDAACHGDPPLRVRVDKLLAAHAAAGGILDQPQIESPPTDAFHSITEGPGTIIGPYKLIQLIGEGGMGIVYMAQQSEPVRRLVALKIIKPGMDSRQVIARFEAERQALALMDHPNIAKVLDAGTTESGRPYFVMELVKGIPITAYCDEKRLTPRERLELFVPVCHAVQHAHQKGIIHRDLKPSNVMIALYDGRPVPKVIDFGVAKAAGGQLTEKTLVTSFGSLVGTLDYMSPEQAELNQLDVDTRSDIYALGVLLYELLTGDTPFDRKRLRSAAFNEMLRIIREEEPPLPSTRLSSVGSAQIPRPLGEGGRRPGEGASSLAAIAASRQIDPAKLAGIIRGEIDWIVMKALEKDRSRRYETANGLARDIQRYLADESVEACPPSLGYRMSKISRRYRTPLTVAASIAALLIIGTGISTWQAIRATTAERAAVASQQKALKAAAAERDAKEAETKERERAEANAKAARDSEQVAEKQRDAATAAQQAAIEEKNNAIAARQELGETIYAIDMAQVQAAAESRQTSRVSQLLDLQLPAPGKPDYRGFEWHYWKRRSQRGRLRSENFPLLTSNIRTWDGSLSFSQGAARAAAIVSFPRDESLRAGILPTVFDVAAGRELLAPFDPFPGEQDVGNRSLTLTISDDGKRLAVALARPVLTLAQEEGKLGRISIRDCSTGREIRCLEIPGFIAGMALTADGGRLAVQYVGLGQPKDAQQAGVNVWDTSTGEVVQSLPLLPWMPDYSAILLSPDGERLLRHSVSRESGNERQGLHQLIQVVNLVSGKELWKRPFLGLNYAMPPWSWSPDGKLIVVAEHLPSAKPNVQLWDSTTGTTLAILDREDSCPIRDGTIDFSPDSRLLAVFSSAGEIYVWEVPELPPANASNPLRIAAPHLTLSAGGSSRDIGGLAFSASGRELHSVTRNSIVTWDPTNREDTGIGPELGDRRFSAAISPDATRVAFIEADTPGRPVLTPPLGIIWDLTQNREVCRLNIDVGAARNPIFSPDGRRLAMALNPSDFQRGLQIVMHDTQTGEALNAIQVDQTPPDQPEISFRAWLVRPVFRPDGGQIAAVVPPYRPRENRGPLMLMAWDTATGTQVFSESIDSRGGVHSYSQDGKTLVRGTQQLEGGTIVTHDANTGQVLRLIPLPRSSNPLFVSARHQLFCNVVDSDTVFWDLATGQERLRMPGFNERSSYALSPDGSRIVFATFSGSSRGGESDLTLWSLKTGRRLLALLKREGYTEALAFTPDGNRLIAAFSQSGSRSSSPIKPIQIWDATPLAEEP